MESTQEGEGPLTAPAANSKSDLDKFKRRLIRAVARLVINEKKPEDEVWEQLKVETKCDCKQVWYRMKGLTMKKLKRLLAANDITESIPKVARMSLSDWLMFDLVLVHEKIDVIDRDRVKTVEMKPLYVLFELVQKHRIEELKGSDLAEAWSKATSKYNTAGRQCSPMLMQLRWYQIKELTRCTFYSFWSLYRGYSKNLKAAQIQHRPTILMMGIAKRFPDLIITNFMEWEERVEKRLVILPEEFDEKIRAKEAIPDNTPDIVLMEPVIETIGVDSDSEEKQNNVIDDQDRDRKEDASKASVNIKHEPIDLESENEEPETQVPHNFDDNSNESNTEVTPLDLHTQSSSSINMDDGDLLLPPQSVDECSVSPLQSLPITNNDDDVLSPPPQPIFDSAMDVELSNLPRITSVTGNENTSNVMHPISPEACQIQDENKDIVAPVCTDNPENNIKDQTVTTTSESKDLDKDNIDTPHTVQAVIPQPIVPSIDEIIKQKAENFMEEQRLKKIIKMDSIVEKSLDVKKETESHIIKKEPNIVSNTLLNVPTDLDYINDGIELVDDGIAFADDDEDVGEFAWIPIKDEPDDPNVELNTGEESNVEASNKFDLKLLMQPIVYTTKLDDMQSMKFQDFTSIKGISQIDGVLKESNPYNPNNFNNNSVNVKEENDMDVNDDLTNEELFDTNIEETYNDEPEINDTQKVKLSSHLLQKPKYRTYDPIKLCKNPDFNTRLKRLNIGFFGFPRNIQQLKACKPMTIDLHKAFEPKLLNGTMYLKSDTISVKQEETQDQNIYEQAVSVVPSAIPVQSLMNNTTANIDYLIPNKETDSSIHQTVSTNERSKVINLPDITEIRRINQRLLTAEVTPVQIGHNIETPLNPHIASTSRVHKHVIPLLIDDDKTIPSHNVSYVDSGELKNKKKSSWIDYTSNKKQHVSYAIKPNRNIQVSWLPYKKTAPSSHYEYLLAEDSLNKIISLMSSDNPMKIKYKNKGKKASDQSQAQKSRQAQTTVAPKLAENNKNSGETSSVSKPEVTIEVVKAPANDKTKRPSRRKFCCWAREKMTADINRCRTSKHKCGNYCTCCCRFLLLDKLKPNPKLLTETTSNTIVLSDDEEERSQSEKVDKTIESVVKESREIAETQTSSEPELVTESDEIYGISRCKQNPETKRVYSNLNNIPEIISKQVPITKNTIETAASVQSNIKEAAIDEIDDSCTKLQNNLNNTKEQPFAAINVTISDTSPTKIINSTEHDIQTPIPRINISIKPKATNKRSSAKKTNVKETNTPVPNFIISPTKATEVPPPHLVKVRVKQLNNTRARLLIDGTKKRPKINTVLNSMEPKKKVMYITSRNIMEPKESPIFLGEHKILLTNIVFPNNLMEAKEPNSQNDPAPALPTGVNIVLMPDGELTYTLSPGVTLSDKEIASMPDILKHIKSQLSAHGIKVRSQENELITTTPSNNISGIDSNLKTAATTNFEPQNVNTNASDATPTNIVTENDGNSLPENNNCNDSVQQVNPVVEEKLSSECSDNTQALNIVDTSYKDYSVYKDDTVDIDDTVNKNQNNETEITQADKTKPKEIESSSNAENLIRKCLLSDLMEMSGISAEDTLANPVVPEITVPTPSDVIDLENHTDNKITLDDINTVVVHKVTASGIEPINLTAVTSFKKLKYASQRGGKFFKLDTVTGEIRPISVCIKTNKSNPIDTDTTNSVTLNKTVIDLTNDVETIEATGTTSLPTNSRVQIPNILRKAFTAPKSLLCKARELYAEQASTKDPNVRPIRLLKSNYITNNLKVNKHLQASQLASSVELLAKAKRRAESIDLSGDDSMLEEYLVDENSDEGTSDSSESSDDEPLAKVAKRIRLLDDTSCNPTEETQEPMDIADEPAEYLDEVMLEQCSDPKDLGISSNNSEEDCILGV